MANLVGVFVVLYNVMVNGFGVFEVLIVSIIEGIMADILGEAIGLSLAIAFDSPVPCGIFFVKGF